MKKVLRTINVSDNKLNYSQRNNVINPSATCGPTNIMQALDYAGWELPMDRYPELTQVEDKFTKFCRTDPEVLDYYEVNYPSMYNNWQAEMKSLNGDWKSNFINSFPPNEVHDVLSFAANRFMGYKKGEITRFNENGLEEDILLELTNGLPVVCSVKFGNYGHLVTIVGLEYECPEMFKGACYKYPNSITNYIIDNTYGRFNFETMKYDAVSGNDEKIPREKFLSMLKPIGSDNINMHSFTKGPATL